MLQLKMPTTSNSNNPIIAIYLQLEELPYTLLSFINMISNSPRTPSILGQMKIRMPGKK
jgi:hypothetical protein